MMFPDEEFYSADIPEKVVGCMNPSIRRRHHLLLIAYQAFAKRDIERDREKHQGEACESTPTQDAV